MKSHKKVDILDYDIDEDHKKETEYYTFDDNDWPVLLDNRKLKYRMQNN